jgi:hypothetical protein
MQEVRLALKAIATTKTPNSGFKVSWRYNLCTRNLPGGKVRPAREADNLTAICEPIVQKMLEPRRLTTLWAFTTCYRDSFTFFFTRHDLNSLVFLSFTERTEQTCIVFTEEEKRRQAKITRLLQLNQDVCFPVLAKTGVSAMGFEPEIR